MEEVATKYWNDTSINTFLRWLKIREDSGIELSDFQTLILDAKNSSLLRRLLAGKEPLPSPPPKKYNYPWYDLAETGQAEESDVQVHHAQKIVNICHFAWHITSIPEANQVYMVRPFNQTSETPLWELWRTDRKAAWDDSASVWKLRRL